MASLFKYYHFDKWCYKDSSYSTNEDLIEFISKSTPSTNILLYTYQQTAGKGQIGRKWHSGSHLNLTFSILFPLQGLKANQQFHLNMMISLALKQWATAHLGPTIRLKWPNDLYFGAQKLAGILIQNTISNGEIVKSVAGIGINVNELNFPKDLPNPISFRQISDRKYQLNELLIDLLESWSDSLLKLDSLPFSMVKKQYVDSMYLIGEESKFNLDGEEILGTIRGVNDNGSLQLQIGPKIKSFNFREIRYIV